MTTEREALVGHEKVVSEFYGRFTYPWRPMYFDTINDPTFHETMVSQEIGRPLAPVRDVWVAGCGTNQALITALQYPEATVLGTDASDASLAICRANADDIGVTNLRLEQQGITGSPAEDVFDLVVCTGVIHHNPDPSECLDRLAAGLHDDGVLELMVYNRFHRRETSTFQQAQRILLGGDTAGHPDALTAARALARSIDKESVLTAVLASHEDEDPNAWADNWMNPCERAYDVDSLWDLATDCGLEIEAPRINQFDRATEQFLWTLELADPGLRAAFHALDDRERWQLVNLLHHENSPMLWFYLRPRRPGVAARVTDAERNARFLDAVPDRPDALRRRYVLDEQQSYRLSPQATAVRKWPPRSAVARLWEAVDGERTMRELFAATGTPTDANSVYRARAMLTTTEFPHVVLRPAAAAARVTA